MNLLDKGLRFYISPDAIKARWMVEIEKEAFYSDYLDTSDWSDEEFEGFLIERLPKVVDTASDNN